MLSAPPNKSLHIWFSVLVSVVLSVAATLVVVERTFFNYQKAAIVNEDDTVRKVIEYVRPAVVSVAVKNFGGGSGFIIRSDGLILTNRHVVDDENAVFTVILSDGKEYPAQVVGKDPVLDIGFLKIEAENLPVVKFGNSDNLYVGQTVLAIGNTLSEFDNSVTKGIVSGLLRQVVASDDFGLGSEVIQGAIQTDAAINPGNSGGPLIDLSGKVVGVNTAVSNRGQLVGFALPVNSVKKIIDIVIAQGKIVHPWIGIRFLLITPELQKEKKLEQSSGALIVKGLRSSEPAIAPNSPAEAAGLKEGDIIIKINQVEINEKHSPAVEIARYSVGDTLLLTAVRNGKEITLPITLAEFPKL